MAGVRAEVDPRVGLPVVDRHATRLAEPRVEHVEVAIADQDTSSAVPVMPAMPGTSVVTTAWPNVALFVSRSMMSRAPRNTGTPA